jgi:uncharacterized protein (DUF302 family)
VDSHRHRVDGIRIRSFPIWTISAAAANPGAPDTGSILWALTVVRERAHRRWSNHQRKFRVAPRSPRKQFEARRAAATSSIDTGHRDSSFPGIDWIGHGHLSDFSPGIRIFKFRNDEERYMASDTENGIVNKPSSHSVDETVEKLKGILQARGVALFALVDHSGEAEKVGMKMRPTKLLIFGNPKAGTPLMLTAPSCAIDLPLKILIWEDRESKVWISYNSPQYLQKRHGLPQELLQNIAVVENLAISAGQ